MTVSVPALGDGHQAIVQGRPCLTCGAGSGEYCDVVDGRGAHVRMVALVHVARAVPLTAGREQER